MVNYGLKYGFIPSGKRLQKTMEHHHFQWLYPLFLWPFSMSQTVSHYQRVSLSYHRYGGIPSSFQNLLFE